MTTLPAVAVDRETAAKHGMQRIITLATNPHLVNTVKAIEYRNGEIVVSVWEAHHLNYWRPTVTSPDTPIQAEQGVMDVRSGVFMDRLTIVASWAGLPLILVHETPTDLGGVS